MYGYYNPYQVGTQMSIPQNYQPQRQEQTMDDRIWVQNVTAAESYLVAPNSFVRLWDASQPVFYEKRSDATGRPFPLEAYEYKRKTVQNETIASDAVTSLKNDINSLNERILKLEERRENNVQQSYADDIAVQPVQADVQRRSSKRSTESTQ